MLHYNTYQFTVRERIRYTVQGIGIVIILSYLFYESLWAVLLLLPILWFYLKRVKNQIIQKRRWRLHMQFIDGIMSISSALNAGYALESAIAEAIKDLKSLYTEEDMIMKEFHSIRNQIQMNITVEKAMEQFGQRTDNEDIICFAQIISTAKRTGGDLISIIHMTAETMRDKVEVKREIQTVIAAKQMEAKIMKIIPLGFIGFLMISSPGFLNPLYHNLLGNLIMTILLLGYLAVYTLMDKMVQIEM